MRLIASFLLLVMSSQLRSQDLNIREFFLYGSSSVSVSSSVTFQSPGRIGSQHQVFLNNSGLLGTGIHSGGIVRLGSGQLNGNISAANAARINPGLSGGTLTINGSVAVVGNVSIGGGSISGAVRTTGSYTGPTPAGGRFTNQTVQQLNLPVLPQFPTPAVFSVPNNYCAPGVLLPNVSYGNIDADNATITFDGPGVYSIRSIDLDKTNRFIFDFKGNSSGRFIIRVREEMSLGKVATEFRNLPNGTAESAAARIFTEVQGTGTAFKMENGSSQSSIRWLGTVYAPNGGIVIGAGTGSSQMIGALWSGQGSRNSVNCGITINSGANLRFVAYQPPVNCTGSSVSFTSVEGVTPTVIRDTFNVNLPCDDPDQRYTINTSTNIQNPTYTWTLAGTANIISGNTTGAPVIASPGTYTVRVSNADGCSATAVIEVKSCVNLSGEVVKLNGQVVDPTLTQFYTGRSNPFTTFSGETALISSPAGNNQEVLVDVILQQGVDAGENGPARTTLRNNGFRQISYNNQLSSLLVTGFIPLQNLATLNALTQFYNYIRVVVVPQQSRYPLADDTIRVGGDTTVSGFLLRKGYEVDGSGISIGVISDSYGTLTDPAVSSDITRGNLPANPPVTVLKEFPFGQRTDEGRAMMQIVHSIAPGAKKYFATGFVSETDMADNILALGEVADIIVDDITYVTAPFFSEGVISRAVSKVTREKGVKYFTSAGNFGERGYEASFTPASGAVPAVLGGAAHQFNTAPQGVPSFLQQIRLNNTSPSSYMLVLQWDDPFYSLENPLGTQTDLDLYITDVTGRPYLAYNRVNIGSDPIEILPFSVNGATTINVAVVNAGGAKPNVRFKLVMFRGDRVEFISTGNSNNSTIVGHANSPDAMAVGR